MDRSAIRAQLAALPAPQNEYEASLPEEEEAVEEEAAQAEDAEEIERQLREEEAAMEREELARRSEVMKRGLPRCGALGARFLAECDPVEALVKAEMNAIVRYEDFRYPAAEGAKYTQEVTLEALEPERRRAAQLLILEEAGDLELAVAARTQQQLEAEFWSAWERWERDAMYDPASRRVTHLQEMSEVGAARRGEA